MDTLGRTRLKSQPFGPCVQRMLTVGWCPRREHPLHLYSGASKSCPHLEKMGAVPAHIPARTSRNWVPTHGCLAQLPGSVCTYLRRAPPARCKGRRKMLALPLHTRGLPRWPPKTSQKQDDLGGERSLQTEWLKSDCLTTYRFSFRFTVPSF